MVRDARCRHVVVRLVVLVALLDSSTSTTTTTTTTEESDQEARPETVGHVSSSKDSRGLFSPRMEYDEWTPLGRGDPLKNDPTYDYVPPVLERVHYWIEPSSRTPDPPMPTLEHNSQEPKVSRVPHKRPSYENTHKETSNPSADSRRDDYEPFFLKFVDGPKFPSNQHRQHYNYHHYYPRRPSSTITQQSNPTSIQRTHHYMLPHHPTYQHKGIYKQRPYENNPDFNRNQSKQNHRTSYESSNSPSESEGDQIHHEPIFETSGFQTEMHNHHYLHNEEDQQIRPPYTMLMPPPLQIPDSFISVSEPQKPVQMPDPNKVVSESPSTTQSSVTFEQSNLVFHHHSSSSSTPEWEEGKTQLATLAAASSQVTWRTPTPTKQYNGYNIKRHPSGNPYEHSATTIHNAYNNPSLIYSPNVEVIPSTEVHFNDSNNIHFPVTGNTTAYNRLPPHQTYQQPQQWSTETTVTTQPPSTITMTTTSSLTTDPLFSHYKQPIEPLRGPMYLIIQGHSKVKTYGANKHHNSFHGIPIQEGNDISQHGSSENKNDRIGKAIEEYSEDEASDSLEDLVSAKKVISSFKTEGVDLLDPENSLLNRVEYSSEQNTDKVGKGGLHYEDVTKSEVEDGFSRKKRELKLEDFIPFDDDVAGKIVNSFLEERNQGSDIGKLIASSLSRFRSSSSADTS